MGATCLRQAEKPLLMGSCDRPSPASTLTADFTTENTENTEKDKAFLGNSTADFTAENAEHAENDNDVLRTERQRCISPRRARRTRRSPARLHDAGRAYRFG